MHVICALHFIVIIGHSILDWDDERERNVPITYKWWGTAEDEGFEKYKALHWDNPLKVSMPTVVAHKLTLLPCWVISSSWKNPSNSPSRNLPCCLIRIRIVRNPQYFLTNGVHLLTTQVCGVREEY